MIGPLNKLEGESLNACIKAINKKGEKHGIDYLRFNYSELRNVAEFLYSADMSHWSNDYHTEMLSKFSFLEILWIRRISKNLDNPEQLKIIQAEMKVQANATRRICHSVLDELKKNKSIKSVFKGVFKNVKGH